jgi:O-antigen/teichoic acid export membrane protein
MLWSLAENFSLQAVQFIVSIVLARLLLPEQFGLIGMLTLFIALAQSILDSGFGTALIQKKDTNRLDTCSVFYFNLSVGILLTCLLFACAPLIASFYGEPILTPLTRLLSLGIFINGFSLVPTAVLTKQMEFKALLKVNLSSVIISGSVGVGLALKGLGVWSIAVQSVVNTLTRAVLLWSVSHWRPSLIFSLNSLKSMFPFGSRMMLTGLINTFFQNIYLPLIGKVYSVVDVGYYARAQTLQDAAIQPAGWALGRVMFPALSQLQGESARLRDAVKRAIAIAVFFHFPLMIGLIVVAETLIPLLLTERWAPSIQYFRLLCVVGLLFPLQVINLIILPALGKSNLFLRLEIIKKLMITVVIFLTYRSGILALLYGQVAMSFVIYFLNGYYSKRFIDYSTLQQIRDIYPLLVMSLLMGASMYLVGMRINPLLPKLLAQFVVGSAFYLGLNFLFSRTVLSDVFNLLRRSIYLRGTS